MDPDSISSLIAQLRVRELTDVAIARLEEHGAAAVPPLIEVITAIEEDEAVRRLAAITLAHIPEGARHLLTLVAGADDDLGDLASWAMRWPPASRALEPVLLALLDSPTPALRRRGARGLRYIGVDLADLDRRVLQALSDPDAVVRCKAIEIIESVLGNSYVAGRETAIESIVRPLEVDPDASVRAAAERVLAALQQQPRHTKSS